MELDVYVMKFNVKLVYFWSHDLDIISHPETNLSFCW